MTKQAFLFCWLLIAVLSSCKNEPKDAKKASPDNGVGTASPKTVAPPTPVPAEESAETTVQPAQTQSLNKTIASPPPKNTNLLDKPVGYVTRENIPLQTEPSENAPKVSTLKKAEKIYILQTIMTNPQGKKTDYPTWYEVMRENKQRGWVTAKAVDVGGGG